MILIYIEILLGNIIYSENINNTLFRVLNKFYENFTKKNDSSILLVKFIFLA